MDLDSRAILDTLRLSPGEAQGLLTKLAQRRRSVAMSERRRHGRIFMTSTVPAKLMVIHPGGTQEAYQVLASDLSAGGAGVLHGSFMYTGSLATIHLLDLQGRAHQIHGRIARCAHMQGKVHELGIRFDAPIDLKQFTAEALEARPEDCAPLPGRVLLVEGAAEPRLRLREYASHAHVQMVAATSREGAATMLRDLPIDLVLTALRLPDATAMDLISELRGAGDERPVVVLADDAGGDDQEQQAARVATAVARRPGDAREMHDLVSDYLAQLTQGAAGVALPDAWSDPGLRPLVVAFIQRLPEELEALQALAAQGGGTALKRRCIALLQRGATYGGPDLAAACRALLAKLGQPEQEEALANLQQVAEGLSGALKAA